VSSTREFPTGEAADPVWLTPLLQAARQVRAHAYAPYSRFAVGAAVMDEQGRVHAGCNVENAAYPQGWCAETSALAAMVSAGGRRVAAVVVVGEAADPVTPCGGCRQKLREFAADDCPIIVADVQRVRGRYTLGQLLPVSFGPQHLGVGLDPSSDLNSGPNGDPSGGPKADAHPDTRPDTHLDARADVRSDASADTGPATAP
jgi:cytidine deaminase